jgi:hypothetical protein
VSVQGFLNQTVQIAARTGFSEGRPAYGTPAAAAARVEFRRRMFIAKDGQQVASTARIYLSPDTGIAVTSQITLPDSTTPEIIDVGTVYDGKGIAIYKVVYA